jgi:hypothetical protein
LLLAILVLNAADCLEPHNHFATFFRATVMGDAPGLRSQGCVEVLPLREGLTSGNTLADRRLAGREPTWPDAPSSELGTRQQAGSQEMNLSRTTLAIAATVTSLGTAANAAVVLYSGTDASTSGWTAAANSSASTSGYVLPGTGTGSGGTYSWGTATATTSGSGGAASVTSTFYYAGFTFTAAGGNFVTDGSTIAFTAGGSGGSVAISVGSNVWGALFAVSGVNPTGVSVTVDGSPLGGSPVNLTGGAGVFGAINTAAISGFLVNFAAGGTMTFDNAQLLIVPAPGAMALLGVAGLVGVRRRR